LRQYVKITAFGDALFNTAMDKIQTIIQAFERHIGEGKMLKWAVTPYEGYRSFEAHARYFTDRDLVPFESNLPFEHGVDPDRILANLRMDNFIHAADNRVEYCAEEVDNEGVTR
jgi:hypothetical protein